jgi:hypothetical protein
MPRPQVPQWKTIDAGVQGVSPCRRREINLDMHESNISPIGRAMGTTPSTLPAVCSRLMSSTKSRSYRASQSFSLCAASEAI